MANYVNNAELRKMIIEYNDTNMADDRIVVRSVIS